MTNDRNRLEIILEAIGDIRRRLDGMDYAAFSGDRDELALTAFRLSLIGKTPTNFRRIFRPGIPDCRGGICTPSAISSRMITALSRRASSGPRLKT